MSLATLYFVSIDAYTYTAAMRFLFKLVLLCTFLHYKEVQDKNAFYTFFGLLLLTDVLALFVAEVNNYFLVPIGIIFFVCYILLLRDAYRQFKIQDPRNVVAFYYLFVILINAVLVILHLINLYGYMEGQLAIFIGQVFYNIALYFMIVLSLAYYLNSYSKKSMYFLIASLSFVCSDILVSAFLFYNIQESIISFHTFLSMIGYVFFFNYFFTAEKPQMIEAEILKELSERKAASKG
ncbi:hypothetical protein EAX61_15780 [Dokdonia sinensis]|uniref:YhhN-like protein n=1 Tax=Dokdonia sinensis TaxID=2479847 RepID=A0A3M0G2L6_9FLAO|nr:hypothetical protein EAX61_15780 [Dokdonia sinensis]